MKVNNLKISDFRYERKFFLERVNINHVIKCVNLHPRIFKEIYSQRFINNIYFDTHNYNNYLENIEGSAKRLKVRIRWYGDLFGKVKSPVLEIKIKNGLLGKKKSLKINSFNLNSLTDISKILETINNSQLNIDLKSLKPTLLNRYSRIYFQSIDKKFRITVDNKQEFFSITHTNNLFINSIKDFNSVILELKYQEENDFEVNSITNKFPFRLTKSSKYVNGIQRLNQLI